MISGVDTDLEWLAEFRGFFWGEGCLDISFFNRKGNSHPSYCPRARIGLNAVDLPLLEEIRSVFGGNLHYRAATNSWTWQLTGKNKLLRLIECLTGARTSAHKAKQVAVFREVLALVPGRGNTYTPETRSAMEACKVEIERLKRAA
jgi:hypothetical protein